MKTWMRLCRASFSASAAASMSFRTTRASPQTVGRVTAAQIAWMLLISLGDETGKPASMMSTPR